MNARKIAAKSVLQFFALLAAAGIADELAGRPIDSYSIFFVLLVAAYRPIWKDGRIIDRVILLVVAALVGLSVGEFVRWLADYLFKSGIFDAGGAANVAGYRSILAATSAYLITRVNIETFTDWVVAQWNAGGSPRLALILGALLAPYPGLIASITTWEGLEIRSDVFTILVAVVVTIAALPFVFKALDWTLSKPLFGLQGERAEGPRRLGLLAGWVIGAPLALLLQSQTEDISYNGYDEQDVFLMPLIGVIGLLLTYVIVHAVFWALEGFNSKTN